jgi:hypothetical protein
MSKSKIVLMILLSPVLLLAKPKSSASPVGAVPPNVQVTVDGMSGSGCPQGSASVALSPDSTVMSVLFDQLLTEINPGDAQTRVRKNCQINLRVWFSGKYRVAIVGSDIRAFAFVPSGAKSTIDIQHTSPFAHGHQFWKKMDLNQQIVGPASQDLLLQSNFADKPLWSPCGTELSQEGLPVMNIALTIDSENKTAESLITTIDSMDLNSNPGLQYHLAWMADEKHCR